MQTEQNLHLGSCDMSEEIIKILDHIGSKFGVAIDWTDKNVMPYLQELADKYINYEIAISATIVIALVVIALILGILTGVLYRKDCGDYVVCGVLLWVCFLAGVFVIPTEIADIIKCITFPEMQIYEYLSGLIQK